MKKIACIVLLASISILYSVGPRMDVTIWDTSRDDRESRPSLIEASSRSGSFHGKRPDELVRVSGQTGVTESPDPRTQVAVTSIQVDVPGIDPKLNKAEMRAILQATQKPSFFSRFRRSASYDPSNFPFHLLKEDELFDFYKKLVDDFYNDSNYKVTEEDLESFPSKKKKQIELVINLARALAREQNRLMKGLTPESKKQIIRVLREQEAIQKSNVDYLNLVKGLVEAEKRITQIINSEEKQNLDDNEIKKDILNYFNNIGSLLKEDGYALLNEILPSKKESKVRITEEEAK